MNIKIKKVNVNGWAVRTLMIGENMTIGELSIKSGIDENLLEEIMHHTSIGIDTEDANKIADALGCNISDLYSVFENDRIEYLQDIVDTISDCDINELKAILQICTLYVSKP